MKRWKKFYIEINDMVLMMADGEGIVTAKELESLSECLHEAVEDAICEYSMDEGIYDKYIALIEKKAQKCDCKN